MKKLPFFWRSGFWAIVSVSFMMLFIMFALYLYAESQLPHVEQLKHVQLEVPLQIYTSDGRLIQEYGEKKRIPLTYDQIPKPLVQALLVTEDQRFFEHPGVDILGLGRAALRMLKTGTKSQGGSTITMQVARNFFLDREKTFLRKFNEILLAIRIDKELTKEKILELYLNKIYLGNRAYGVEAAAQVYYGRSLKDLSLAEWAMIAGLPQAPSTQNPITNPKAAEKRRNHVLTRMFEEHLISKEAYHEALKEPVHTILHTTILEAHAPYVAEMIRQSLFTQFGPDIYSKGYKVYTTIDSHQQHAADASVEAHLIAYDQRHGYRGPIAHIEHEKDDIHLFSSSLAPYPSIHHLIPAYVMHVHDKAVEVVTKTGETLSLDWAALSWARPALRNGWVGRSPTSATQIAKKGDIVYIQLVQGRWKLSQIPEIEAALIALDPENGAVRALVGGFDFVHSKFNRATQSGRQPGSSFKPFLYAAALQKGYSLASIINDAPITMNDVSLTHLWRPHNVDHRFGGPTRLKDALIHSKNLVSIRILDDVGIDYVIDFIAPFGFSKQGLPRSLSLALGTLSTSPLELARAYAVFANGGYKVEPYLIEKITDSQGQVLMETTPLHAPYLNESASAQSNIAPRIISEDIAFLMHTALQDVIQQGTAQEAKHLNRQDLAGKTGTTNDQFDAWFCGYQPHLVAVTWVGYDNPASIHEYGAQIALPLWIDFMRSALQHVPETRIKPPLHIVTEYIDPKTGLKTSPQHGILEYFRESEIPISDDHAADAFYDQENTLSQESLF